MGLLKKPSEAELRADAALVQRLETITSRGYVEKAIHERRRPLPEDRD
jgi:hypothetical protein